MRRESKEDLRKLNRKGKKDLLIAALRIEKNKLASEHQKRKIWA
jgi:hypothetical protein